MIPNKNISNSAGDTKNTVLILLMFREHHNKDSNALCWIYGTLVGQCAKVQQPRVRLGLLSIQLPFSVKGKALAFRWLYKQLLGIREIKPSARSLRAARAGEGHSRSSQAPLERTLPSSAAPEATPYLL